MHRALSDGSSTIFNHVVYVVQLPREPEIRLAKQKLVYVKVGTA